MYCKNCGKFIGTDADVCDECKQKEVQARAQEQAQTNENTQYQPENIYQAPSYYQQQPTYAPTGPAINLGKAIAAMILSFVGFIFTYVAYLELLVLWEPAVVIVALMGLVPCIIGLVFGCKSISNFKQTAYTRSGKRIPVLILGILSVINAATGLLFVLLSLLFALTM
jgi:hypothetical protein